MRDVVNDYKNSADFWVDCHTSKGWDYDYYVQCNTNNTKIYKGLFNDPATALKLHYSYKMLGVSCFTVEMTPQRFSRNK